MFFQRTEYVPYILVSHSIDHFYLVALGCKSSVGILVYAFRHAVVSLQQCEGVAHLFAEVLNCFVDFILKFIIFNFKHLDSLAGECLISPHFFNFKQKSLLKVFVGLAVLI